MGKLWERVKSASGLLDHYGRAKDGWDLLWAGGKLIVQLATAGFGSERLWRLGMNEGISPFWVWLGTVLAFTAIIWTWNGVVFLVRSRNVAPDGKSAPANQPSVPPVMETVRRHVYRNEEVEIDGRHFDHCVFENVTFVLHGAGAFKLEEPEFHGTTYLKTEHPAAIAFVQLGEFLKNHPRMAKFVIATVKKDSGEMKISSEILPLRDGVAPAPPPALPAGPSLGNAEKERKKGPRAKRRKGRK